MNNNDEIGAPDVDYSIVKGVANEPNWQKFVLQFGGELVAALIVRPGIKNADFLFRTERVVAELKILETEFLDNVNITNKLNLFFDNPVNVTGEQLHNEIIKIIQAPLQRIINKANRQIKETKHELRLVGWRGLLIIVNDGFKGLPPGLVMGLCAKILSGKSYSSCDAFVYLTNHCVELPDDPYARLLWAPLYHPSADQDLRIHPAGAALPG